jgi:hypothetical protein
MRPMHHLRVSTSPDVEPPAFPAPSGGEPAAFGARGEDCPLLIPCSPGREVFFGQSPGSEAEGRRRWYGQLREEAEGLRRRPRRHLVGGEER